jgi:myo-inositol-1-phosphate synthase
VETGEAVFTNRSYRGEEIVRILALNLGGSTDRQELLRNPNRRKKKARKRQAKKKAETRDYRDELPLAARERGPG